jgi:apolipoprotein N-acyltransferase
VPERCRLRRRFWVEAVLAGTSALLLVLTLISREWIELIFGVDPDSGSGAAEWLIVVLVAALAFTCSALARIEWRRWQAADGRGGA